MYSTHDEGKSVVDERFIRTLKSNIYKYMNSISRNMYVDKLDDIVNKYNNKYHRTIKMKPADVNSSTFIDFNKENNNEDPKFKVGDHGTDQNMKIILQMDLFQIGQKKILFRRHVISDLNGEETVGTFYKKELQRNKSKRV